MCKPHGRQSQEVKRYLLGGRCKNEGARQVHKLPPQEIPVTQNEA